MRIKELIKKEIEEEVTKELRCDNCNKDIEYFGGCGSGPAFKLSDAWCGGCGGKYWEFCSFDCIKEFINNNKLEEPSRGEND